jgi:DNA sulfur modification protein DndD
LRDASQVFEAAVDRYKSDLRGRVQATASDLFLRMSTEKEEYGGLEINENYGLHIVHKQGGVEEGRSAGAEHVVALALMGALQRNAPFRGPIVMDSPLFRLDPGHKTNVLLALPTLAPQVVLLVHEGEARRERVRELLGEHLVREYELVKLSARRTDIRPVT